MRTFRLINDESNRFKGAHECIIKGVRFYRVENGWCPVENLAMPHTALICSGNLIEKSNKAQIGEVRKSQGQRWKKVSDDKWVIVIESKEK